MLKDAQWINAKQLDFATRTANLNQLQKFRKRYKLSPSADLRDVAVAVDSVGEANDIAFKYIAYLDNKTENAGFIVHSQLNILGRIFEQTQGMLVCISTGCPTSAEALGRVVIEGSINLMYMATKGNASTIIAFFESWLQEHERKLNEWKGKIEGKEYENHVGPMIDERLRLVNNYKSFIDHQVVACNIEHKPIRDVWPKSIFKRFSELGKETEYYESYHRLSGSSHISAEDTISWLVSLSIDEVSKHKMAKEAVSYSIMMSRMSCLFFIDAAISCCMTQGFKDIDEFNRLKKNLVQSIVEISDAAGVPKRI